MHLFRQLLTFFVRCLVLIKALFLLEVKVFSVSSTQVCVCVLTGSAVRLCGCDSWAVSDGCMLRPARLCSSRDLASPAPHRRLCFFLCFFIKDHFSEFPLYLNNWVNTTGFCLRACRFCVTLWSCTATIWLKWGTEKLFTTQISLFLTKEN